MIDRFRTRKNGIPAATVAGIYATIVLIISLAVLIALLGGKDSVALWPLWLITSPLGFIVNWLLSYISFDGIPEEQRWAIPIVHWIFLLISGLLQAWFLWLLFRGPRLEQPNKSK
ncbi:SCO4225 family membrane protein [Streptosporangium subroseum]|uniref:SCO4225 family membrane protein n=1 Tax=Streptosporangium subroseum TaxID=106412 RepID=UPI003F4DDB02